MPRTAILITLAFIASSVCAGDTKSGISTARQIEFKAPDGIILKGTYYPAAKPGPAILLLHMCRADASKPWAPLASKLADAGFHVLAYDYRGYGFSGGDRAMLGDLAGEIKIWREKWSADMDAALAFLLAQPGVNRDAVAAAGASCGVYMSLLLAERHPALVKSLVLLSGPIDEHSKQTVRRHSLAIFAVASDEDGPAPDWMTQIFRSSANSKSNLQLYKQAGHGTDMFKTQPSLENRIVKWFSDTLRARVP